MSDKSYYIPKHLDDPPKLFWWDADEVIVFCVLLFPGLILKSFILLVFFFILSVFVTFQYAKLKAGKLRGFLWHFTYWVLGILKINKIPKSNIREISG